MPGCHSVHPGGYEAGKELQVASGFRRTRSKAFFDVLKAFRRQTQTG